MSYQDLILQESEFTYSANIQFDVENDRKLAQFIPNEAMLSLLKEFFVDIIRSKPIIHSRILYGSYGTGKSHFLTILSQLLGKRNLKGNGYTNFINRISDYDMELSNDIQNFVIDSAKKPYLIVPIVFDFDDFERCIYFSLQKALERAQIKVNFKIFYTQASQLLEQWESSEESRERLLYSCEKNSITLSELKDSLKLMEKNSEGIFQKIFADITFGVKFIYETADIIEILQQANHEIADRYSGIIFIFDEFGRYMEDNIKNIRIISVQRIAEFCDHSAWNNHIILVSHKEIAQYTVGYNNLISDEWKKVEGRYKAISINDKDEQCLTLLKHILIKHEPKWTQFKKQFSKQLGKLALENVDFKGFLSNLSGAENICEDCFPLHPISLYALDKLSKHVAQSERTFFTYLASNNENSLYQFLQKHDLSTFHFVGLDEIYDYFEPNIQSLQSDPVYDWYRKLQAALAKAGKSESDCNTEVKILKSIALIGIVNETEILTADRKTLINVIDDEENAIGKAIDWLCEKRIIRYFGFYNWYEFYDTSIFNIDDMLNEELSHVNDEAMLKVMNEELIDFVIYPRRYNRDYKISRVLVPIFITVEEIKKQSFSRQLNTSYDGHIIMLMGDDDTSEEEILLLSCQFQQAIIFCRRNCKDLKEAAKRYVALHYLEIDKDKYVEKDPTFEKELDFHKNELSSEISQLIKVWRTDLTEDSIIGIYGKKCCVYNEAELNECASQLMYDIFPDTLIVNNELINKNIISATIQSAKRNAIQSILTGDEEQKYFGLPFLSPDFIAVRSVLTKNGFYGETEFENKLTNGRCPQFEVKNMLDNYLQKAKSAFVDLEDIINGLKMPPFGLREGYLSLLLTYWFSPFKKSLLIDSHGREQEITAELFEEIVRRPHDFRIYISSWSTEQQQYLERLEELYGDYLDETLVNKNRLKAIYEAMFLHFKSISKFARMTEMFVSDQSKRYRILMSKSYTNYSQFLFQDLNALTGNYLSSIELICNIKEELESVTDKMEILLEREIRGIFILGKEVSLSQAFKKLNEERWGDKQDKVFDYYTNAVLDIIRNLSGKEGRHEVIAALSKSITGFAINYWNDAHKAEFIEKLVIVNEKLEKEQSTQDLHENETKMVLSSSAGEEYSVVFDKTELSDLGKVMKNKIDSTLNNFSQGVVYEEKIQVLLTLLKELIHLN